MAWVLQILLGVQIILPGQSKFTNIDAWVKRMETWGYSLTFMQIVGILEIVGGILVFFPRTVGYGILIIVSIMIGAIITHLLHDESFIRPLALIAFGVVIFILRKPSLFGKQWLG